MPTDETLRLIPQKLAERFRLLPIRRTASTLTVVTSNLKNVRMLQDLERQFGLKIDARQVSEEEMAEALDYAFGDRESGPGGPIAAAGETGSNPSLGTASPSGGARSLSGSQSVPSSPGLQSLDADDSLLERTSNEFGMPSLGGLASDPAPAAPDPIEDTLGSLDDMNFDGLDRTPSRPRPAQEDEGLSALFIERARAHDSQSGVGVTEAGAADATSAALARSTEEIRTMLHGALRMGATEIFFDSLADRVLLRARIGFRTALLNEFDLAQGGQLLAHLRTLAGMQSAADAPDERGRIHLRFDDDTAADFFVRALPGGAGECQVLDAVRFPGARLQPLKPRGISDGSPSKLRDHLAGQLGDKRLAGVVARQLTRPPSLLAVVAPRHRNRESMLALLAGALSGPALGQRVVYAGERPRYYLDGDGVVLLPTGPEERADAYLRATRMGADYALFEEIADYDELALATEASVGQHVICGIPGADPIDILVFLTEAPEPRRLAQRLGSILFLDAQSMKIVEMNQPLREAVGSMEDAGTFVQMFEGQAQTAAARPTSTEIPAMADPFKQR